MDDVVETLERALDWRVHAVSTSGVQNLGEVLHGRQVIFTGDMGECIKRVGELRVVSVKEALHALGYLRVGPDEVVVPRDVMQKAIEDFDALTGESEGVYGLHLNGNPAPWDELTAGGYLEEWTAGIEKVRAYLHALPPRKTEGDAQGADPQGRKVMDLTTHEIELLRMMNKEETNIQGWGSWFATAVGHLSSLGLCTMLPDAQITQEGKIFLSGYHKGRQLLREELAKGNPDAP